MKHLLLFVIIIITYTNALQAQTKIWGAGTANGTAAGEFQNAFVNTSTNSNYAPNTWTALSVYDTDTIFPGNAYWTRSTLGYSQGAYWGGTHPASSTSQSNGVAIFDSDYLDNNGVMDSLGIGTSPSRHKGELISPRIDLSGYADSILMVQFFSLYRDFEIDELSLSLSLDDGATWNTTIDYRTLQDELNGQYPVRAYFPNFTAGVSNLANCRLKFIFEGAYYFAILDDVSIEVAPNYDLAIARPNPNSPILAERGDYIKIGNNRYFASVNMRHYDLQKWYFGLRAVNHGSKDLLPSDSAKICLKIDAYDYWSNLTTVYRDTIHLTNDSLLATASNSIFGAKNLRDLDFIDQSWSYYYVTYWLEHNQIDAYGDNDTLRYGFSTINSNHPYYLHNYFSKARLSTHGKAFASAAIFPAEKDLISYEYGSMFYFHRGNYDRIKIDSIDFRYLVPYNYTGDSTDSVLVTLYQFIDNPPADGLLNSESELVNIGEGLMHLKGLGTTTALGYYGSATVGALVNSTTGVPVGSLDDNAYYVITIKQQVSIGTNSTLLDSTKQVWFGVDESNYAQNMALTDSNNIMPHPFITISRDSSNNIFVSREENRLNMVPSIGIHLNTNFLACGIEPTPFSLLITLDIYPNPAQDYVIVQANFKTTEAIQYLLTDVSGRIIQIQIQKETTSPQRFNLKKLPAGTYFILAKNKTEEATTTFVKN